MRHLLLLLGLLYAITATAQLEVSVGAFGTNYIQDSFGEYNSTDTEFGVQVGVAKVFKLKPLFTVQDDRAWLSGVIGVDAFIGPESGITKVLPSGGVRIEFPLFIEYGVMSTFHKIKSYFASGVNIGDNFSLNVKLLNFNPYYEQTLMSYSVYMEQEVELKRTIAMGLKWKF